MDWLFWGLASVGVFLTGISKSGFAGGMGVIAVPLLLLVTDPLSAVAFTLPILVAIDAFTVGHYWRDFSQWHLLRLLPSALIGVLLGAWGFSFFDAQTITLLIGILSIIFGSYFLLQKRPSTLNSPLWPLTFGTISGLTSFVAHAGGPPVNAYLLTQSLRKQQFLATVVIFLAAVNIAKLVTMLTLEDFRVSIDWRSLLLLPLAWLGVKAGLWCKEKLSERAFFVSISVLLVMIGVYLVGKYFTGG